MNTSTPIDAQQITAAVLSGGQGSRIGGRDKGLLALGGRTLAARVVERMRAQCADVIICANRNATEYSALARVYADRTPTFRGPLAGIRTALHACDTAWVLTVPVDCPDPPTDLARRLAGAVARASAQAAVAHDGGRRQPLFALYHRDLEGSADAALARDLAVWRWQDEIGAVEVDFADRTADFCNLNTDADFARWRQRAGDG